MPSRTASGPSASADGRKSSRTAASCPAVSCTVPMTWPGRVMVSTGSAGTGVSSSAISVPSTASTSRPTPAAPTVCGPEVPARNVVSTVTVPLSPQPMPGGSPSSPHQANTVDCRCSEPSSAPPASRYSTRTPGSPETGSRIVRDGGSGTISQVWQPAATLTSACPARASRSASAGVDRPPGMTAALPPPWMTGCTALGPITATDRIAAGSRGSAWSSFRSSTRDAAAARRSRRDTCICEQPSAPAISVCFMSPSSRSDSARRSRYGSRAIAATSDALASMTP